MTTLGKGGKVPACTPMGIDAGVLGLENGCWLAPGEPLGETSPSDKGSPFCGRALPSSPFPLRPPSPSQRHGLEIVSIAFGSWFVAAQMDG